LDVVVIVIGAVAGDDIVAGDNFFVLTDNIMVVVSVLGCSRLEEGKHSGYVTGRASVHHHSHLNLARIHRGPQMTLMSNITELYYSRSLVGHHDHELSLLIIIMRRGWTEWRWVVRVNRATRGKKCSWKKLFTDVTNNKIVHRIIRIT
jgi:hypothetical protein